MYGSFLDTLDLPWHSPTAVPVVCRFLAGLYITYSRYLRADIHICSSVMVPQACAGVVFSSGTSLILSHHHVKSIIVRHEHRTLKKP